MQTSIQLDTDGITSIHATQLIQAADHVRYWHRQPLRASASQNGAYLSRIKGRGMEFEESRPYQPGDDVRALDWKVMARSGRAHTKVFREEREQPILLWVDLRDNMHFATRRRFKSVAAAELAAMLAWATHFQGDRLGALLFNNHQHMEIKPRAGRSAVLQFINRLVALDNEPITNMHHSNGDNISNALRRLQNVAPTGSRIYLLSDFYEFNAQHKPLLARLCAHADVTAIQILDPIERGELPAGRYRVTDGNRQAEFVSASEKVLAPYQNIAALSKQLGLSFLQISTEDDAAQMLRPFWQGYR
ncbi:MAG: DUF58 domain-containing protein [Gammaproteobacteria bacterium]|nr:DUF58 domain-containing protein [Gammaproteobacteria bacterium]